MTYIKGFKIIIPNVLLCEITNFHIPNNLKILVFGGALNSNCFRDKVLSHLKKENKYLTIIPDKINYFDIATGEYNLVEKETRLFENSDILIIIPESAGSFAEIGMISSMINNPHDNVHKTKYAEKILIILDENYKHDESFLKLGPIKSIKRFGGKTINVNFQSTNISKITHKLDNIQKKKIKNYNITHSSLFFSNSIKILLFIYYKKSIKIHEQEYKTSFINKLKEINKAIDIDNIEYLESTELITKNNTDGEIIIKINYEHHFIKQLIDLNFKYFLKNKFIISFLKESGY